MSDNDEIKLWGTKRKLRRTENYWVDLLFIKPRGFCSIHYHRTLFNQFNLVDGELIVKLFENGPHVAATRELNLTPNISQCIIPPHTVHQFLNPSTNYFATIVEIVFAHTIQGEVDIERFTCGGCGIQ